ncbi:MAG: xanthine dehydrogenase family protein subunit M [Deltaproteobacteria bacterium]|nr:xanthine dehydrogenase family protein subunit M [Deltaproteobacteria bacterium]
MLPRAFDYYNPSSLAEAAALLKKHGGEAKILSGGHSLVPLMKLRFASPAIIIDLNSIAGLDYLKEEGGMLKIGALARESALESSAVIKKSFPILADAAKVIADPLVRNRATIVGNLAHGDPANDHPAVMLALGAELVATNGKKERVIHVNEFFLGTLETALKEDEILKEVRVPIPPAKSGGAYLKIERKVGDFAIVAVAAQVTLDDKGQIKTAGIGLTNVGPVPIKATAAEAALVGKLPNESVYAEAGRLAADASKPASDNRAPADYKKSMVREFTIRALRLAVGRAQGGK